MSPRGASSSLITSAPRSDINLHASGPATYWVRSRIRRPEKIPLFDESAIGYSPLKRKAPTPSSMSAATPPRAELRCSLVFARRESTSNIRLVVGVGAEVGSVGVEEFVLVARLPLKEAKAYARRVEP